MKVIINRFLPIGKKYYAINLFGVIFAKGPCDSVMLRHEAIHTAQMRELGYIFFYLFYVAEWLWRLIRLRDPFRAYRALSFEREAYNHETDASYLSRRKHFAQFFH